MKASKHSWITPLLCILFLPSAAYVGGTYNITMDGSVAIGKDRENATEFSANLDGEMVVDPSNHTAAFEAYLTLVEYGKFYDVIIQRDCTYTEKLKGDYSEVTITCPSSKNTFIVKATCSDCNGNASKNPAKKVILSCNEEFDFCNPIGACYKAFVDLEGTGRRWPTPASKR